MLPHCRHRGGARRQVEGVVEHLLRLLHGVLVQGEGSFVRIALEALEGAVGFTVVLLGQFHEDQSLAARLTQDRA